MILPQIIEEKKKSVLAAKERLPQDKLINQLKTRNLDERDFKSAISRHSEINLIAEIKKASPSRGIIRENFNLEEIAKAYQLSGASAISVLTEEKFFLGSLDYINKVKRVSSLPILRKDFIMEEYQVYESKYYGADAILLIADILAKEEISRLMNLASTLNMSSLVEAHSEEDLQKTLGAEAGIVGINNRDLQTFKLNLKTSENLMQFVPKEKITVIESGIKNNSDMMFFKSLGANAVLVGEALMDAADIGAAVKQLLGKV